ncbi:IS21 family transposase [Rubrimonas cliftonensis]|uniref:Integrase core domain-containing protein n=1 Tax=Rubrimonas cliftonensis TaxID=89524 RepID=A0A1H4GHA1_9RHOB|nr:IS21 family transposase [Rubrimonas cliftonensis]SEB08995.1 Integrase core domain-containing protein [Rubrimonas cliftonensis]
MGRLDDGARTAMTVLLKCGQTQSGVARLLGVTEGAVRYHRRRQESGATDGRSRQVSAASAHAEAIAHWRDQQTDGRINLAALHDWLRREHGYGGSLKSVQRYWRRTFPAPAIRARRRVETPAGAQAQVDWAEYPGMVLGAAVVDLVALVMTLSWSRKRAMVWARSKDMLSWQACHTACFRRLGGVPAVLRIDNVKTGVSKGAGAWGEVNPTYRRYAGQLKFHVDACQPRQPQAKGKVERGIGDQRGADDPYGQVFDSLEALQAWTDARVEERSHRLSCPVTGTSVAEAWGTERALLTPLPETLPEPFDVVVRRPVGVDCMVSFEGRRYSVPFRFVRQEVEVRGLAGRVQILRDCAVIADHPRGGAALIVKDDAHYEGESTERVIAPQPLGRMGRRLQELAAAPVHHRSIDLYARLAEVAR